MQGVIQRPCGLPDEAYLVESIKGSLMSVRSWIGPLPAILRCQPDEDQYWGATDKNDSTKACEALLYSVRRECSSGTSRYLGALQREVEAFEGPFKGGNTHFSGKWDLRPTVCRP